MDHPQDSIIEAFVIGALPEPETAAFIAHVSECDVCAKKLEAEAKTELAIVEVVAASKVASPVRARTHRKRRPRLLWGAAGGLALAAAILLLVLSRKDRGDAPTSTSTTTMTVSAPRAEAPIPLVVCADGLEQEKCVEEAHRHGLFVSYPPWASAPPLGGGRSGPGPNGSPFAPQQM